MRSIHRNCHRFGVLSHVTPDGKRPTMVDVSGKSINLRVATAMANVKFPFLLNDIMRKEGTNGGAEIITKKGHRLH